MYDKTYRETKDKIKCKLLKHHAPPSDDFKPVEKRNHERNATVTEENNKQTNIKHAIAGIRTLILIIQK